MIVTLRSDRVRNRNRLSTILLLLIIIGTIGVINASSQGQTVELRKEWSPDRLIKDKASVYLAFKGESLLDEDCSGKKRKAFQLSIHNNMTKPINIDARYGANDPLTDIVLSDGTPVKGLPNGVRVALCYDVEAMPKYTSTSNGSALHTNIPVKTPVPDISTFCNCSWNNQKDRPFNSSGLWVAPGGYVLFDVPQEYLKRDLRIFTLFNYEWEFEKGNFRVGEPHHQVYFYSSDLRIR